MRAKALPGDLEEELRGHVLGQDGAVAAVARWLRGPTTQASGRGLGVFIGPPGTGRTALSREVARLLFGSRRRLIRVDMARFPRSADAVLLSGGHVIRESAGPSDLLVDGIGEHPDTVVLCDMGVLTEQGFDPERGARRLAAALRHWVAGPLDELMGAGAVPAGAHVVFRRVGDRLEVEVRTPPGEATP